MSSAICTVFERNYHYGVATLVNSLCHHGFKGTIYAGYRGSLPKWMMEAQSCPETPWEGASILEVTNEVRLCLLPIVTSYHLANYKPDFLLRLLDGPAQNCKTVFYFDCDIILNEDWKFFEMWASEGVSMCEDGISPMPLFHPRRMAWRKYFRQYGITLEAKEPYYLNGGLLGVTRQTRSFLMLWKELQEAMAHALAGGLSRSVLSERKLQSVKQPFWAPFSMNDQDALNAAYEATDLTVSILNKSAMGFSYGHCVAPHAVGGSKPWDVSYLIAAFKGSHPSIADKVYWRTEQSPLRVHSRAVVLLKRFELRVAAVIAGLLK